MAFVGVYKITNNINGKFYIGRSKNIRHRWVQHRAPCTWNGEKDKNKPLYKAMQKYGVENFSFDIIKFNNTPEEAVKSEYEFIKKMKPQYNIMNDLSRNLVGHSAETRKKIGDGHRGKKLSKEQIESLRKINLGSKHTEEHKRKIGEACKGKRHTVEARIKISRWHTGKVVSEETKEKLRKINTGKKQSDEAKRNMSIAQKGKIHSKETRRKLSESHLNRFNPYSKVVIRISDNKEFKSTREASRETGTGATTITNHCRNNVSVPRWKYKNIEKSNNGK